MDYKITEIGGKVVINTHRAMPSDVRQQMAKAGFSCNRANNVFIGLACRLELAEEILDDIEASGQIRGTTLCTDCAKAVGRCSWSGVGPDGKTLLWRPVPGWKAVKTRISGTCRKVKSMDSYRVISCPEFVRG